MNQAFSAKRQASRKSGRPWRSHTARTARRLASDTGWPPTVVGDGHHHERDVLRAALLDQPLERGDVHVALERGARARVARRGQVERFGAGELDVGPRRVEVRVVGHDLVRAADDENRMFSAARPWWVGITCSKRKSCCTALEEA